jgi:hypothetical protein
MIRHSEYLTAKQTVENYENQMKTRVNIKLDDLSIDQEVQTIHNQDKTRRFWVSEIVGEDVLIRTTFDVKDNDYDDFLVNICDIISKDEKKFNV